MSAEQHKAIVRRFVEEVVNRGNLDAVDELIAADYILHLPGSPEPMRGREAVKQMATLFRSAFRDWHDTIEDTLAEGNRVVTRWTERGTHTGGFQGIAPTGRLVTLTGIDIFRLDSGKIVEAWVQMDVLGMMQQLGAIPPMQKR